MRSGWSRFLVHADRAVDAIIEEQHDGPTAVCAAVAKARCSFFIEAAIADEMRGSGAALACGDGGGNGGGTE